MDKNKKWKITSIIIISVLSATSIFLGIFAFTNGTKAKRYQDAFMFSMEYGDFGVESESLSEKSVNFGVHSNESITVIDTVGVFDMSKDIDYRFNDNLSSKQEGRNKHHNMLFITDDIKTYEDADNSYTFDGEHDAVTSTVLFVALVDEDADTMKIKYHPSIGMNQLYDNRPEVKKPVFETEYSISDGFDKILEEHEYIKYL